MYSGHKFNVAGAAGWEVCRNTVKKSKGYVYTLQPYTRNDAIPMAGVRCARMKPSAMTCFLMPRQVMAHERHNKCEEQRGTITTAAVRERE